LVISSGFLVIIQILKGYFKPRIYSNWGHGFFF